MIGTFNDLSAPATASHIHGLVGPGVNAAVIVALTVDNAISGSVFGSGILTLAQIAGMENQLTYLNIHDAVFPGGDIRGQIVPAPEPVTVILLGLGGIGWFAAAWHRR